MTDASEKRGGEESWGQPVKCPSQRALAPAGQVGLSRSQETALAAARELGRSEEAGEPQQVQESKTERFFEAFRGWAQQDPHDVWKSRTLELEEPRVQELFYQGRRAMVLSLEEALGRSHDEPARDQQALAGRHILALGDWAEHDPDGFCRYVAERLELPEPAEARAPSSPGQFPPGHLTWHAALRLRQYLDALASGLAVPGSPPSK